MACSDYGESLPGLASHSVISYAVAWEASDLGVRVVLNLLVFLGLLPFRLKFFWFIGRFAGFISGKGGGFVDVVQVLLKTIGPTRYV